MAPVSEPGRLFFRDTLFGLVRGVFCHQGTWFGDLTVTVDLDSAIGARLAEFAAFSASWNERQESDEPADLCEFGDYTDMTAPGAWVLRFADDATEHRLRCAPSFRRGGEISWISDADSEVDTLT